jgi:hypothetical protein
MVEKLYINFMGLLAVALIIICSPAIILLAIVRCVVELLIDGPKKFIEKGKNE